MDSEERRALLEAVARGEVSPDEAAERLHDDGDDDRDDDRASPDEASAVTRRAPTSADRAEEVRIEATAGRVEVVADPTISEATADGEAELHRDGSTLVITTEPFDRFADLGFVIGGRRARHRNRYRRGEQVTIRVNPDLPLILEANASAVRVRGLRSEVQCSVNAAAVTLHNVSGPVTADVNAGSLSWKGRVTEGHSRVSCDVGSVKIRLAEGSDVRVCTTSSLGRLNIGGLRQRPELLRITEKLMGEDREVVVGAGTALLEVEGSLSSVSIDVPDHEVAERGA